MIELIITYNFIKLHLDNFFAVLFAIWLICIIVKNILKIVHFILERKLKKLKEKIRALKDEQA